MSMYDKVKSFMELTGITYLNDATNWLDKYDWDVEAAIKAYNKEVGLNIKHQFAESYYSSDHPQERINERIAEGCWVISTFGSSHHYTVIYEKNIKPRDLDPWYDYEYEDEDVD